MFRFLFSLVLLFVANISYAASYTITTTVGQDKALQYMVAFYNQRTPTAPVTATQLLQQQVDDLFKTFDSTRKEAQKARLGDKYEAATPAVRQQVDNLLP